MKYITIATDVSCDAKTRIAAWACYIRHSEGVIQHVSQLASYNKKSAHAETYALINALVIAKNNIKDWEESRVIIYNEIDHVLSPCRTKSGKIKLRDEVRAEAIMNIAMPILDRTVSWEKRDIKAHYKDWQSSPNAAAYFMNRWCDTNARKHLKKLRRYKKRTCNKKDFSV